MHDEAVAARFVKECPDQVGVIIMIYHVAKWNHRYTVLFSEHSCRDRLEELLEVSEIDFSCKVWDSLRDEVVVLLQALFRQIFIVS